MNDLSIFSSDVGAELMRVILEPADGAKFTPEEISSLVTVRASVTTVAYQTGDTFVFYVSASLLFFAIIAVGSTLFIRSRRRIDI